MSTSSTFSNASHESPAGLSSSMYNKLDARDQLSCTQSGLGAFSILCVVFNKTDRFLYISCASRGSKIRYQ